MDLKTNIVSKYLEAISNKDIDFMKTIFSDDSVVIMPNGQKIERYAPIISMHVDWFADVDWNAQFIVLSEKYSGSFCFSLIEVVYNDKNENEEDYSLNYYLYLVFENTNGAWTLLHDQNTIIK